MKIGHAHELPAERVPDRERARRLGWLSVVFLVSAVVLVYLVMGSSQAMKAAWIEDLIGLVPAISFLVADRVRNRPPDRNHPYGFHRSISIAYFFSSIVLLGMGLFILVDSGLALLKQEHPTIGSITILGHTFWLGWLMIAVLIYTIIPAVLLGRAQIPVAKRLHDKALYANAKMLKADWATAAAGIVGVLGIGVGLWWADAVAAIFISADITHDGWKNTRTAVREVADGQPVVVAADAVDPLRSRLETELGAIPWVTEAYVRLRSEGHVFYGDALVVPTQEVVHPSQIEEAVASLRAVDWRLHEITLSPVESIGLSYEEE